MCRFSLWEYTWITHTPTALFQIGLFVATVGGLTGVVYMFYPDKPATPREFTPGLENYLPSLVWIFSPFHLMG